MSNTLNRAEIAQMTAPRLRLAVARKFFGLNAIVIGVDDMPVYTVTRDWLYDGDVYYVDENGRDIELPDYTADITAAWLVHKAACVWRVEKRVRYFEELLACVRAKFKYAPVDWPEALAFIDSIDICRAAYAVAAESEKE